MTDGKIKINWIEDSSGLMTCHLNEPRMSARESYVGKIFVRKIDGKDRWFSRLSGSDVDRGPHRGFAAAREDVEDSVDGEQVDPWNK